MFLRNVRNILSDKLVTSAEINEHIEYVPKTFIEKIDLFKSIRCEDYLSQTLTKVLLLWPNTEENVYNLYVVLLVFNICCMV